MPIAWLKVDKDKIRTLNKYALENFTLREVFIDEYYYKCHCEKNEVKIMIQITHKSFRMRDFEYVKIELENPKCLNCKKMLPVLRKLKTNDVAILDSLVTLKCNESLARKINKFIEERIKNSLSNFYKLKDITTSFATHYRARSFEEVEYVFSYDVACEMENAQTLVNTINALIQLKESIKDEIIGKVVVEVI